LNANALSSRCIQIEEFIKEEEEEQEIGLTTTTTFFFFNVCPFFRPDEDIFLRAKKDFDLSSSTEEEEEEEAPPAKLDANESIHRRGLFFNALIDSSVCVCV